MMIVLNSSLLVCRLKSSISFLTRPDRPNLAYHKLKGRNPGVVFLPGLNSNMNGQKATALEDFCNSLGHAFVRYIQSIVFEKMKQGSWVGGRQF